MTMLDLDESKNTRWNAIANRILDGGAIEAEEAVDILQSPDDELMDLLAAAYRLRRAAFGKKVRLHFLMNAKSGRCEEDCHYCSQSRISDANIDEYELMDKETILDGAKQAEKNNACTFCIVASGREPRPGELDQVCEAVEEIKENFELNVCACLGLLTDEDSDQLQEAGVDRVNHNLNTSKDHYPEICTTHTYEDRVDTLSNVRDSGIELCSGVLLGMGETERDMVDVALHLSEIDVKSLPVNFLNPIDGTPLEDKWNLNPRKCLKILCMYRFTNPETEVRIAGGREVHLRSMQPLALYPANSMFVGDYLTTSGQESNEDLQMIEDMGFEVELAEGQEKTTEPEPQQQEATV
jgi:biotin synthase